MHFLVLLLLAALSSQALAKTILCPSCSQDDFENAYYVQSVPGDTIVLPAGTATWGNSSRGNAGAIYLITAVTVQGQGDSTVITMDDSGKTYAQGVIALWAQVTFKDLKIIGASAGHPVTVFNIASYYNPTTKSQMVGGFRLTNITYEAHSDGYFAIIQPWVDYGIIDNCRLSSDLSYTELIFMRGRTDAWQIPNSLGKSGNIFIEDCTFNNTGYVCDANANGRMVVRFNTMNGTNKVDAHGLASNSPARSFRNIEVYHNNWTKTGAGNWANIEIRGGTSIIFKNTSVTGWNLLHEYAYDAEPHGWPNFGFAATSVPGPGPTTTTVTTSSPHGYKTSWPVWMQAPGGAIYGTYPITVTSPTTFTFSKTTFTNLILDFVTAYKTPYDYPIRDQIGAGKDGGPREPAYVFRNTQGASPWPRTLGTVCPSSIAFYRAQTNNPTASFTERDVVKSNRDFFADAGFDSATGVASGTAAQMRALSPTVPGFGFWVTDEGEWNSKVPGPDGRLYTWSGSAWSLYYTPFTYPHPCRGLGRPTGLHQITPTP
jgi:hypothetical protein